jgi:HD-like signal output (HDOD) protein
MSFESIVHQVESLPPIPESVQKIQELFSRGSVSVKELVAIIEEDPILTSEILSRANAPIYSFSRQIASVTQAVTLFGAVTMRGLVLSFAAMNDVEFTMEPYNIGNSQFQTISSLQSALMFQWYMGVDIDKARTLIPVAFLMNMGKVVIAREIAQSDYEADFKAAIAQSSDVRDVERLYTDMTASRVNALLFDKWHFEEVFIRTMEHMDDDEEIPAEYKELVQALRVVETAVNINAQLSDESIKAAADLAQSYGLDPERFEHAAIRLKKKHFEG